MIRDPSLVGYCPVCYNGNLGILANDRIYCRIKKDGSPGCGWKGKMKDVLSYEEIINIRRTELIDEIY